MVTTLTLNRELVHAVLAHIAERHGRAGVALERLPARQFFAWWAAAHIGKDMLIDRARNDLKVGYTNDVRLDKPAGK